MTASIPGVEATIGDDLQSEELDPEVPLLAKTYVGFSCHDLARAKKRRLAQPALVPPQAAAANAVQTSSFHWSTE